MSRGDVDDPAPVSLEHPRQNLAGAVEHRREVEGDHVVPSVRGKLDDRRDMLNAGVIHQDVHASENSFANANRRWIWSISVRSA